MADKRVRAKSRKTGKPFFRFYRDVLESHEYSLLSGNAVKLLLDLGSQYRGNNNGDLGVWWKLMRSKGWKSKATLYRALNELEAAEFILRTRQGGMNRANLFALTWFPIDECSGKLDVRPSNVAPNTWRKLKPPVQFPYHTGPNVVPMRRKDTR